MRFAALMTASLFASQAYAGGIAPFVIGGFHTESVPYYSTAANGGNGPAFDSPNDYEQYFDVQLNPNLGAGLEFTLGDKDQVLRGVFRAFWFRDFATTDPALTVSNVKPDALVSPYRADARDFIAFSAGLQAAALRAVEDRLHFGPALHVGAGAVGEVKEMYMLIQPGVYTGFQINRNLEVTVEATYGLRIDKSEVSHGVIGAAAFRYLFD